MNQEFFSANREQLTRVLKGRLIVITGYTAMQWRGDEAVPFRQEANFWYLTGIEYADWTLVINGKHDEQWLIMPGVDETHQVFNGGLNAEEARKISGVAEVITAAAGDELLRKLRKRYTTVYTLGDPPYAKHAGFMLNPAPKKLRRHLKKIFSEVKDYQKELAKLRAIKQPLEIQAITKAAELTIESLEVVKKKLSTYTYEYEAEAELAYLFRRRGGYARI